MSNQTRNTYWTVACFEEGPLLRHYGPLWMVRNFVGRLVGDYDNCWVRFLRLVGDPNTEKSRRKWRNRGFRRVRVAVTVELAELNRVVK